MSEHRPAPEEVKLSETSLTNDDVVKDIGFHLLKIAEETKKLSETEDPLEEQMAHTQLLEHVYWVRVLSGLLVTEEK